MCVCVCVCVCVFVDNRDGERRRTKYIVRVYVHTHTHTGVRAFTRTHTHTHTNANPHLYICSSCGLSSPEGNLLAATYTEMQKFVSWIEHSGSRWRICDQLFFLKSFTYALNYDGSGGKYPTDVKSDWFRFRLEASRGCIHSELLRYNKTGFLCVYCRPPLA